MKATSRSFDRLARIYRALEFLAFGADLERARFWFLEHLRECRSILVLGEGDGRCLARLVEIAPSAAIHCIDISPAMLERAAHRLPTAARDRVTFTCANALEAELAPERYDAIVTCFFLDCFSDADAGEFIERHVRPALQPDARWLFADFVLPPSGWRRWRAQVWLAILYTFFRWQTGIKTRSLPDSERHIAALGFQRAASREFQSGLIRSAVFRRSRGAPP